MIILAGIGGALEICDGVGGAVICPIGGAVVSMPDPGVGAGAMG